MKEVLTFKIRTTIGTGNQILDSSLITINVVSCLDLNTISNGAGLVALTVWQITNSDPTFPVNAFTYSDARCPITKIEIFSDDTASGVNPPTSMYPGTVANPLSAFNVYSSVQGIEFDYLFYIKVTGTENQIFWAELASSRIFTLRVICGPSSTTITEGAFSGGLTAVQYIDKNVGGSFKLPQFTSSVPGCPIITYLSSNQNTTVNLPASGFVQNPSLVSTDYLVFP